MTRKYAQRTKVPVTQSRNEIERMLMDSGATGFGFARDGKREAIRFVIKVNVGAGGADVRHVMIGIEAVVDEAEQRRRWRALVLIVKAKLEAINSGISTIEREFLADIVMPDGSTVGGWLQPQIDLVYQTGKMPPLLPAAGGTSR